MSTKEQLSQVIAGLPDEISLEDAVERLYLIFKIQRALGRGASPAATASGKRKDLVDLVGLLASEGPPPTDAEVEQLLEDERIRKYE
jgi:hypothetical protein